MLWIRDEFPDVYKRTAKFVTISGYIVGKTAGLPAFMPSWTPPTGPAV